LRAEFFAGTGGSSIETVIKKEAGSVMEEFLMKPKVDFAFKEIMFDTDALKGFVASVMKLDPAKIRSVTILNTDLRKVHAEDKQGILDVNVLMNDDTEIDIEIQLMELRIWPNRSLFYLAKKYVDQIKEGDSYSVFNKCVSISILDFKLFKEESSFYSCFHITEDTRRFLYTDRMEFHVIELPKLPEDLKGGSDPLLLWAKFISSEKKEDFEMLAEMNEGINSAYKRLKVISQDDKKRREYDARMKAIRDYNQGMIEAREAGLKEGMEKSTLEIVKNMLSAGFDIGVISQMTNLSESQIKALR